MWPRTVAQQAVRDSVNATQALKLFRAAGGRARNETWYRFYGQAQLEGDTASREASRSLNRVPTAGEIQHMTTRFARGNMQRVNVYGLLPGGEIISRPFSIRTRELMSRQAAIQHAIREMQAALEDPERRDRYPWKRILTAVYTGTFRLSPEPSE